MGVRAWPVAVLRCWVLVALLPWTPASAETNFSAYLKSFAILQEAPDLPGDWHRTAQSQNSLRLMWDVFADSVALQFHYELSPVFASRTDVPSNGTFAGSGNSWRVGDLGSNLDNGERHDVFQNLDRLNLQVTLPAGDLTLGRQAITFGAARVISPTDIFLPFDVRTFNQEYRVGVDAIRYQQPLGSLGELDLGYIAGDDGAADNSAAYLQARANANGNDMFLVLARFADQNLAGVGLQRALGDLGFWLEAAHVAGDQDYWRASIGLDRAFGEYVFGQIEYHYNGAGSGEPADYASLFATPAYRTGGVFLLGEHYLMPSLSITASPLTAVSIAAFINLSDESAFLALAAQRSLSDNLYADAGLYLFGGSNFETGTGTIAFGSEYGGSPALVYASLRYYF